MDSPDLYFRRHADIEDLALTFVEQELGRYDWLENWKAAKARGNLRERVSQWLEHLGVRQDPDTLIEHIDEMARSRPGRWR